MAYASELPIDRGASANEMAQTIFGDGVTVVLTTHQLTEAEELAGRALPGLAHQRPFLDSCIEQRRLGSAHLFDGQDLERRERPVIERRRGIGSDLRRWRFRACHP